MSDQKYNHLSESKFNLNFFKGQSLEKNIDNRFQNGWLDENHKEEKKSENP